MSPIPYIGLVALGSLLTSFFCSMLEACLYSVSRSRVETLARGGDRRGRILARLRLRIDESIAAILIVNTIANTVGAAWIGALVAGHFGNRALGLCSAIFTILVLFFAEITPKSLGVRFASVLAPALAIPLQLMVWILYPIIKIIGLLTRLWGRDAHISHGTADDIISLTRLIHEQGELKPHEVEWVTNALKMDEITAFDLMTPSPVVARIPASVTLRETKYNADHWRFSRLPVCKNDDPDTILGIIHRRKVFEALARDEFHLKISDLMDPPEFVPETIRADLLLDQFIRKRRHLFCVHDENGVFSGVVTLEDVIEALLGREIVDETDLHEDMQALAKRRKNLLLGRFVKTGRKS